MPSGMRNHVESDRYLPVFEQTFPHNRHGVPGRRMFFRNVTDFIPDCTVSHTEDSKAVSRRFVIIKLLSRKCLLTASHWVMFGTGI